MTATAVAYAPYPCPKCGAKLFDNRATKQNPKAPDLKCSNYKAGCDFVEWPPKNPRVAKPVVDKPRVTSNVPDSQLPEFLRDADAQDMAELREKIGEVPSGLDKKAQIAWAQRQSIAIVLEVYEPMFVAKNIGLTDDVVHKLSYELFRTWTDKGII